MNSDIFKKIYGPLILGLAIAFGVMIGNQFNFNESAPASTKRLSGKSSKISYLLNLIDKQYVDTVDVSKMEEDLIPDLLEGLDPHSVYIPAKNLKDVNQELDGSFGGIGVQFNVQDDSIMVIDVISGGPSEKVGILPGDRIVSVNDSVIVGEKLKSGTVVKLLRGPKGTDVTVGIVRKGADEVLSFDITRGTIPLYSVDVSYMINKEIGYIKVSKFGMNTYNEFLLALGKLKMAGATNMVIDLRGNSGGYIEAVARMTNEFFKKNKLIVYTEGKGYPRTNYFSNGSGTCKDMAMAVLIDEWSASASEIFAGAVQDNDRGVVVGRRSFGKGLVQNQLPLGDGSAIRLTIARYYTPAGRCIQKAYEGETTDEYYQDIYNRYKNGEMNQKDSIHMTDTIAYQTVGGRLVYGGGGIMPDFFVALDTTGVTPFYDKVVNKQIMYKFTFKYADENRKLLAAYETADAMAAYLDKQDLIDKFVAFARENGVEANAKDLKESRQLLHVMIKAYIARNVIDNEGFYPIIHEVDITLKKAVELLSKEGDGLLSFVQK